jgi:hypothetical protein
LYTPAAVRPILAAARADVVPSRIWRANDGIVPASVAAMMVGMNARGKIRGNTEEG